MGDCLLTDEIEGLVRGTLPAGVRARVLAHLSECDSCSREFARRSGGAGSDATVSAEGQSPQEGRGVKLTFSAAPPPEIEGYEILSKIHEGGQGVVYKALQKSTRRSVAVKVLRAGAGASERQRRRFEREIKLAANLKHPNIVTIYDSKLTPEGDYCAMEYIHGQPVDAFVVDRKLGVDDVLRLMVVIADAVSYAHRQGVIHRDLKPGNILVDERGQPHVLDFGLAKSAGAEWQGDAPLTLTSEFMGTLAYASPEQTRGDPSLMDARTDVYSLGVLLHRLLTGEFPYEVSTDPAAMFATIRDRAPTPPSQVRDGVSREVDTIVLRALAKDVDRRYQTAGDLARDIERFLAGDGIEARPDSAAYLFRRRYRSFVTRQPVVTFLAVVLVATLLAQSLGVFLVFEATPLNAWFERWTTAVFAAPPTAAPFRSVRVVALRGDTDVDALGRSEGLAGVSAGDNKSLRRLHGRLMTKLAAARPSVVAWDIAFRRETEFDADFARGVEALGAVGTPVVVGVPNWRLDQGGRPELSPVIAPSVRWGSAAVHFSSEEPWKLQLAFQSGLRQPQVSLALAAVMAHRHPDTDSRVLFDRDADCLDVVYERSDPKVPRARIAVGVSERIDLSAVQPFRAPVVDFGIDAGDLIGHYPIQMPTDDVLAGATLEYGRVLTAAPHELSDWFDDRIVLVGDLRPNRDRHEHPSGRRLPGVYGHAAAIESILGQLSITLPAPPQTMFVTALAAVLGALAPRYNTRRGTLRWAGWTLVFAVTGLAAAGMAFRLWRILFNPGVPIVAFVAAWALAATVQRHRPPAATC